MSNKPKTKLLVILGPTATGKSDLAIHIAKLIEHEKIGGYIGAEVISADSRQVYSGMDIGTGKITEDEMRGIPHHLLNVADPRVQFNVIDFKTLAEKAIVDIVSRGKLPIICGGTGFYIDTLLNNEILPNVGVNNDLRKELSTKSVTELFSMLEKMDHIRANNMNASDRMNPRRLVRAIEIASKFIGQNIDGAITSQQVSIGTPIFVGLQIPHDELRNRIKTRLTNRIKDGMIDEARKLHEPIDKGGSGLSWERMEELGLEYRYESRFLQGKISMEEMTTQLETEIWRYAKRQMTWFKRNPEIKWFEPADKINIEKYIVDRLKE